MPDLVSSGQVLLIWAIIAYVLGSIPFGMVLAKVMGLGNLREIGSGNIGATNVLRTGSKKAAALTLALDGGKGLAAVLLASSLAAPDTTQVAGLAVMVGHCFPVWLRFQGGKGVATFFGVVFGLAWPIGIVAAVVWIGVAAVLRYSSLAALLAALSAPVAVYFGTNQSIFFLTVLLCALIFLRHGANIRRLVAGAETKIGQK